VLTGLYGAAEAFFRPAEDADSPGGAAFLTQLKEGWGEVTSRP